jgi:hypothetical protein
VSEVFTEVHSDPPYHIFVFESVKVTVVVDKSIDIVPVVSVKEVITGVLVLTVL